jgi:leucyl/phenylalanyl-tRNA--protein transferase
MTAPYWLNPHDPTDFPNVSLALRDPDGLLAVGGDLSIERLLTAYQRGIFPWYSGDQPILWWSPDPRSVLFPNKLHISRSLRKTLRKQQYVITSDTAFAEVVRACSEPRADGLGTWITDEMQQAYIRLHQSGYAHSIESWLNGKLVGGLYGVAIGHVFFGESMFSRVTDASKVAFVFLVQQLQRWQFGLIDCQIQTDYLNQFGAELIPRSKFVQLLGQYCKQPGRNGAWSIDADLASSNS